MIVGADLTRKADSGLVCTWVRRHQRLPICLSLWGTRNSAYRFHGRLSHGPEPEPLHHDNEKEFSDIVGPYSAQRV